MKKIGIVGSRRRDSAADFEVVHKALDSVFEPGDWLVSGGCPKGADRFAETLAKHYGIPILIFYPDWNKGRLAGLDRNTLIAETVDILIAAVAPDRKGGSEDTVRKFQRHTKSEVILV